MIEDFIMEDSPIYIGVQEGWRLAMPSITMVSRDHRRRLLPVWLEKHLKICSRLDEWQP